MTRSNRQVRGVVIVEQSLSGYDGHYYEYDRSVRQAAVERGLEAVILAHRTLDPSMASDEGIRGVFRDSFHDDFNRIAVGRLALDPLISNHRYYRDLRRAMGESFDARWVVFVPTIDHRQMLAWSFWLSRRSPEEAPRPVFLFRTTYVRGRGPGRWGRSVAWARLAFRLLERLARRYPMKIAADSRELAAEYGRITSLPIEVFPIPHCVHPRLLEDPADAPPDGPLRLVSLGDARMEKGWDLLSRAICLAWDEPELRSALAFTLQCNTRGPAERGVEEATARMRSQGVENVTLVDRALTTDEYYSLLADSDCVLLPYRQSVYRSRTSGVAAEAMAGGKPVIVTEGTWMASQVEENGAGVTFGDGDPRNLVEAMRTLLTRTEELKERALRFRGAWQRTNNPSALVAALCRWDQ